MRAPDRAAPFRPSRRPRDALRDPVRPSLKRDDFPPRRPVDRDARMPRHLVQQFQLMFGGCFQRPHLRGTGHANTIHQIRRQAFLPERIERLALLVQSRHQFRRRSLHHDFRLVPPRLHVQRIQQHMDKTPCLPRERKQRILRHHNLPVCPCLIPAPIGETGGARTRDHKLKRLVLYQLSYRPNASRLWAFLRYSTRGAQAKRAGRTTRSNHPAGHPGLE